MIQWHVDGASRPLYTIWGIQIQIVLFITVVKKKFTPRFLEVVEIFTRGEVRRETVPRFRRCDDEKFLLNSL